MGSDLRDLFVHRAVDFVVPELAEVTRRGVEAALSRASSAEVEAMLATLGHTGESWGYHPPNRLARDVNWAMADVTIAANSEVTGHERLGALDAQRVVYLANHLSFSDANLLSYLLHRSGHTHISERLCVLAGPKVFTEPFRRFSSLSFGAIKIPQSQDRASGEAVMDRREVARLARQVLEVTQERLEKGDHLLIFVEGTRSRTASMNPALPAVSRYLDLPECVVVPVGIVGSEHLVPIGEERAHLTRVQVTLGAPHAASRLREVCNNRRSVLMHAVGLLIAELLPESYRGFYGSSDSELDAARAARAALT